ncbi:MAG: S26 family signal peptidase [Pirellulales bacterium]
MLAIFVPLVRTWLAESCVIVSGSMAPTLVGPHRDVVCSACGIAFAVGSQPDSEPLWTEARAICPNCGSSANPLGDLPDAPGDGLLVSRGAFGWRRPRRWEPVVFRDPSAGQARAVKRVVGFPGETIRLVDGNVVVDGQIASKPLDVQRSLAILVNDDRYRPMPTEGAADGRGISCWQARDADQRAWQFAPGEFRFVGTASTDDAAAAELAWIDFRPRGPATNEGAPSQAMRIDDHYGYNQSRPILELHTVNELLLCCDLRVAGDGTVQLRAADGNHVYEVTLDVSRPGATLAVDGQTVFERDNLPRAVKTNDVRCEVSTIDRQFMVAFDGEALFEPFEMLEHVPRGPAKNADATHADGDASDGAPLSIGAHGVDVRVRGAQVFRDIYYTNLPTGYAKGTDQNGSWRVGMDELFVLGDNSPVSHDSRVAPNVAMEQLLGRPVLVYAPRRAVSWLGRQWNLLD